ncbi:hypothetical protein DPMN_138455 [Dreissena polymorpha]|uniref:Uncharacterized protein n=1 Tax=Dreissena polymorpha TaxID=45954 RepID=A0A9D4G3V8_DREPO|nr:hypothetical protein DPMN_138455 [Dreissena polymorpha]
MKLQRYIDHDSQMTPIDFQVTSSPELNVLMKRGYIALLMSVGLSVGPSTRWLSDDKSRTLGPRIMKLHRYIDHASQMTPIDFEVTRSKVKVTITPIDFEVTRSKVKVTVT